MIKKMIALSLCLFIVAAFSACSENGGKQESTVNDSKVKVSVTFDAMKEFVQAVGGDKVEISAIIPDGTEPHDFEPKAKDLEGLSTAQIFVYNGFGMESWVGDAIKAVNNKNLITVEASKGAAPIENTGQEEIKEHGQYDPHLWLSLKGAEIGSGNIRDALIEASPPDKAYFQKNYDNFVKELDNLYSEYNTRFQSNTNKSFVTGHAAFAYLCRDFGLNQNSVEDVFAEGEPSAQKLTELVDYCKENHVGTIFVEDMVSPAVSQTLANEVGAKVEAIHTIESGEDNMTYLDRMKDNLAKISDSLSK